LKSIVVEDETQCYRYDPETKRENAESKLPASTKGKNFVFKSEDNACVFL